jgi:cell division protein FtsI (penicillin-binding protein 3)
MPAGGSGAGAPRGTGRQQGSAAKPTRSTKPTRNAKPTRTGKPTRTAQPTRSAKPARTATPTRTARATTVSRAAGAVERRRTARALPKPASPERRQRWLLAISAVVVVVFVGRLVQIQVLQAGSLAADAREQRMQTVVTPAHRGDITDRNGTVLATSVDRYTISADQKAIQQFRGGKRTDAAGDPVADGALGVAQLLAPVLGVTKAELAAKINGEREYVVLAKNVVPEKQRAVRALGLAAYIRTDLTSSRRYPSGTIAGTLVGFVDSEQKGQGGVERAYDSVLTGTPGIERYEQSLDGVRIPGGEQSSTPGERGGDVVLTLDYDVQWKAQSALDAAVRTTRSAYGMVLVKDNRTGEMLAIADSGSVDPNNRSDASVAKGSRAVQDTFEPGSTGKVVTMAAALETGAWTAGSQFTVPYHFTTPNGQTFQDSHEHPVQRLTLAGVLARSSNSGTVQIAEKIPPQVQYDYLKKFGFGQSSGLGLTGESRGVVHPVDRWDGRTRYTVAFGQGLTVNALQATNVFSTVANGGVSVPPTLVKGTRARGGELVPATHAKGQRVISKKTADTLLHMMEEVTSNEGTAASAQIPGYRVAGKTGTAEIFLPGGGKTYMASFIGVAPADDPRYTVSVFLKSPKSSIYGGVVAAPVFKDVMGFVLQKEAVPPSRPAGTPLPLTW